MTFSAIVVAEIESERGRFVVARKDTDDIKQLAYADNLWAWCGKALGWMPFETTNSAFFKIYTTEEEAFEAGHKYLSAPLKKVSNTN